jgi:hypothetical protein
MGTWGICDDDCDDAMMRALNRQEKGVTADRGLRLRSEGIGGPVEFWRRIHCFGMINSASNKIR